MDRPENAAPWWDAEQDPERLMEWRMNDGAPPWRKVTLYACACCRRIWVHLTRPASRAAVEMAERFADGLASSAELRAAREEANRDYELGEWAVLAAASCADDQNGDFYDHAMHCAAIVVDDRSDGPEAAAQADLIRDIFGNPFRPVTVNPAWRTANVSALAQAIYDDRAFDRLPILADALEDAGCDNADILNHCRQPGEHVRGCWVVDWILGKE
jgi:hypothetical protein